MSKCYHLHAVGIFSGLKIVDLTRVFSGPFATRHFADLGAEVIKIEPLQGDDSRSFPPLVGHWSGYFEILNRNKKSIFLDLKKKNDLETLYSLCKTADVFVENFSPGVKAKLKIDYKNIKTYNKEIIYASLYGISASDGRKYYDVLAQAESGLISLNGAGTDMKNATSIVDAFSGMKLAFAIASALCYRQETGNGQSIGVSMRGSAFDLLEQNLVESSVTGRNPEKVGNMDSAISPFGIFACKDGNIVLAIGNETLWNKFLGFLKRWDAGIDKGNLFGSNADRLKNNHSLQQRLEAVFKKFEKKELIIKLSSIGVPCAEVKKMLDVLSDSTNFSEGLLVKRKVENVGLITEPAGGLNFSRNTFTKPKSAPKFRKANL